MMNEIYNQLCVSKKVKDNRDIYSKDKKYLESELFKEFTSKLLLNTKVDDWELSENIIEIGKQFLK